MKLVRSAFCALVLGGGLATAALGQSIAGVASVIDGDTIEIHGQRIRLHAIDAPESSQRCNTAVGEDWRCGRDAAWALSDMIGSRQVICEQKDIDRYGRMVAVCHLDDMDIARRMVAEGWAVAYRKYGRDYVSVEEDASSSRRGLWSGRFEMPWDWRKARQ